MPDEITERFFSWADSKGFSREEIAQMLKINKRSVSTYRSSGLTLKKQILAESLMRNDTSIEPAVSDEAVTAFLEENQNLVLKPTEAQFNAWTAAFKSSPAKTLQEWALSGLDTLAKIEEGTTSLRQPARHLINEEVLRGVNPKNPSRA